MTIIADDHTLTINRSAAGTAGVREAAATRMAVTIACLTCSRSEDGKADRNGQKGDEFFHEGWRFGFDLSPQHGGVVIGRGAAVRIRDASNYFSHTHINIPVIESRWNNSMALILVCAVYLHGLMTLLRSILLFVTWVTQALPVGMISASAAEEKCAMSCCAALAQDGKDDCGCASAPGVPTTPSPASLPPAHGREIMPQLVWEELSDFQVISSAVHADTDRALRPEFTAQTVTMPHVRLTVLFCSFLT